MVVKLYVHGENYDCSNNKQLPKEATD